MKAGQAGALRVTPSQLVRALTALSPNVSALVVGFHGIGKSQIVKQVAENLREIYPEHEWPFFDERLALKTEGDLVGIPDRGEIADTGVTRFLPVDFIMRAHLEPCVILLDEINRAEVQIMNSGFQLVGARELNGLKLHPETRVIACVNPPEYYQVNEMDPALIDRFMVLRLKFSVEDWIEWARGRLDDALVDFIMDSPQWLNHDDPGSLGSLEVAPTPRSWEKLDQQLKHAGIPPTDVQGRATPDLMPIFAHGLVGTGAANAFIKYIRDRSRFLSVDDVLDNWTDPKVQRLARQLRHEEILSCISRIGDDAAKRNWSDAQAANLVDFAMACLSGEDKVFLFSAVTKSNSLSNVAKIHNTPFTDEIVERCNSAKELTSRVGG